MKSKIELKKLEIELKKLEIANTDSNIEFNNVHDEDIIEITKVVDSNTLEGIDTNGPLLDLEIVHIDGYN